MRFRNDPEAEAVINPNRADCRFPFKHLAGVGIAFNFLIALREDCADRILERRTYPNLKEYLDLVALGTVGIFLLLSRRTGFLQKSASI
jgi:single-stranded-DNA-specific exonuclease